MWLLFDVLNAVGIGAIGEAAPVTDTGVSLFKYFFVVIIFIFLAWIFTKSFGGKLTGARRGKLIRHVETTGLGGDRRMTVVEVAGIKYLVYSDRTGSILIDKRDDIVLPEPEEVQGFPQGAKTGEPMAFSKSFKAVLEDIVKKKKDN